MLGHSVQGFQGFRGLPGFSVTAVPPRPAGFRVRVRRFVLTTPVRETERREKKRNKGGTKRMSKENSRHTHKSRLGNKQSRQAQALSKEGERIPKSRVGI